MGVLASAVDELDESTDVALGCRTFLTGTFVFQDLIL